MSPVRHLVVACVASIASCAPGQPVPGPIARCSATIPPAGASVDSANVRELAGSYDIDLLNTAGGWAPARIRLRMSLQPTDSTPAFRFGMLPGPRPLQGTAVYESDTTASPVTTIMVKQTLYIGPGIDGTDWRGNELRVDHFTSDGFRGTWAHSGGIAVVIDRTTGEVLQDPKGFFCAHRRRSGGA